MAARDAESESNPATGRGTDHSLSWLLGALLLGILSLLLYVMQFKPGAAVSILAVELGVAGGALLLGALLGFIFGIPRALQAQSDHPASASSPGPTGYGVNTNLEQISDWFTKILVGAGLTQLRGIGSGLRHLADLVAPGMGGTSSSSVFALAVIVYFLLGGFLAGYLRTRLFLAGAFRAADLRGLVERVQRIESQQELDARALTAVQKFLNPDPDEEPVRQSDLNAAVAAASGLVRAQIFERARVIRQQNWRAEDKSKLERTIPVFEALIEADGEGLYHRNHAQLGYALKDKSTPEWDRAEAALSEAIRRRDAHGGQGRFRMYEFVRAFCRIKRDPQFQAGKPTDERIEDDITSDLTMAAQSPYVRRIIANDETVQTWFKLNNLRPNLDRIGGKE